MKFNSVNMDKMKKSVKKGLLVLGIGTTIGTTVVGGIKVVSVVTKAIENQTENLREATIYNNAMGLVDAAKYEYISSLLTDEVIISGNAADLEVSTTPATSGTWNAVDMDNDGVPEIILKDVEIDGYIINTDSTTDEYDLNIKKRLK